MGTKPGYNFLVVVGVVYTASFCDFEHQGKFGTANGYNETDHDVKTLFVSSLPSP